MTTNKRGNFDEILLSSLALATRKTIDRLVHEAAKADHIDEHGGWDFGCEFDDKQRGLALNWDLYGYGRDRHSKRMLAVIQVRQYEKRKAHWWPSIRKSYFLLGRNEDGTVFAHAVQAQVVRSAIRRGKPVVKAVQDWLWGADYSKVTRQGDIGLVPRRCQPKADHFFGPILLEGTHYLSADEIRSNDDGITIWARNAHLLHLPDTHPEVSTLGWSKVVTAKRAETWDFAAETID